MPMQNKLELALLRLATAINTAAGKTGTLSNLTTTDKTSLVAALNEVKASIPTLSSLIVDTGTSGSTTWSSTKINAQINSAISAIVNGAGADSDTLKELADKIVALAQADNGLLSFTQSQSLSIGEQLTACNNLGIGDPAHDYVPAIEAALNAGL